MMKQAFQFGACLALSVSLAACGPVREEMWAENDMPAPGESWSEHTIQLNPDLSAGQTLSLERACEIALDHHPDLAAARGTVEAANAQVGQSLAAFFPQLSMSAGATRSTSNSGGNAGHADSSDLSWDSASHNYRGGARVSQLVFDFGRTRHALRQTEHGARASADDFEARVFAALLDVRDAYFGYMAEQALVGVSEESVRNFERRLDETRKAFDVGRRTRADVVKSEVDLGEARLELVRARNRVAVARLTLNRALGLQEDPGYVISQDLPDLSLDTAQEDAVEQSRLSRSELRASDERYKAAEENLRKVWTRYLPSFDLSGSIDATGASFPLVRNWSLGAAADWLLFNGFRTKKEVIEAEARLRSARADMASVAQQVYFEVNNAWLSHQESKERIKVATETVASAEESLRLITGRYENGRATILEQTDAELALSRARAEEIRSRYDEQRTAARLLRGMGLAAPGADENK